MTATKIDPEIVKWAEGMAETARMNLEKDGEICPVAFILTPIKDKWGLEIVRLQPFMGSNEEKDFIFSLLKFRAKQVKALAVLTIIESWMRMFDLEEERPDDGRVFGYADKKECVIFNLATPQGNKFSCMEIITKLQEETKTFGPFSWNENLTNVEGRAFIKLERS